MHLNTVVFFSAAFSLGSEFQASCLSLLRVIEVTRELVTLVTLVPQCCFKSLLILSSCLGILKFDET